MKLYNTTQDLPPVKDAKSYDVSRRRFLQLAGGIAGTGAFLAACKKAADNRIFVGRGDVGLLNFLYIIEQLKAGFYVQANATTYYGLTLSEMQLLADLRDHDLAHVDFLALILAGNVIPKITLYLSPTIYADRTSMIANAIILEDLAVASYNGVMQSFSDAGYLPTISKMASVEARHAQYVRDLLNYNSFGDISLIDANGLGQSLSPQAALAIAQPYIQTQFDGSTLPA